MTKVGHTVTTREETARHSPATNMMVTIIKLHMTQKQVILAPRSPIKSIGLLITILTTNARVTQNSS